MHAGPTVPYAYVPPPTPSLANVRRSGVVVYAWGRGDMGQLAVAADSFIPRPVKVMVFEGGHSDCSIVMESLGPAGSR